MVPPDALALATPLLPSQHEALKPLMPSPGLLAATKLLWAASLVPSSSVVLLGLVVLASNVCVPAVTAIDDRVMVSDWPVVRLPVQLNTLVVLPFNPKLMVTDVSAMVP